MGHFFLAFKVASFMDPAEFGARMEESIARLKSLKPASGFDEILYPGELEARKAETRRRDGIPLTPEVVEALVAVAQEVGARLPDPLSSERTDAAAKSR